MSQKTFPPRKTTLVLAAWAALTPASLHAQSSLYWDRNDSAAGPGTNPLTGFWRATGATDTNWNANALGTATTTGWVSGSNAIFNATTTGAETYPSYKVQLLTPVLVNSLTYSAGENNAVLFIYGTSPTQTLNLAPAGAEFNVSVTSGAQITLFAPLTGASYLQKQGAGDLWLVGQQNYSGAGGLGTVVRDGRLVIIGASGNAQIERTAVIHENADTYVGSESGDRGFLAVSGGGLLSGRDAYIGTVAGTDVVAQVSQSTNGIGSLWKNNGTAFIGGNGGKGELRVSAQGTLQAVAIAVNDNGYLAVSGGGTAQANTITVDDGGYFALENGGNALVDTVNLRNGAVLQLNARHTIASLTNPPGNGKIVGQGGSLFVTGTADIFLHSQIELSTAGFGGLRIQHSSNSNLILDGLISGAGPLYVNDRILGRTFLPTVTIPRANTNTGITSISGAALVVTNPNGSATGMGDVDITDGSLAGTGSITGKVNLSGTLSPGLNGVGTLTLGSGFISGYTNFDLATPGIVGGATNDLVNVAGNFDLFGILNVNGLAGFGDGTYRLFNYGGTLGSFSLSTAGNLPGGYDYAVSTATPGQVNLLVSTRISLAQDNWDGPGTTANGLVGGGSGSWDNTTTNWTNSTGATNSVWSGRNAVFGGNLGTVLVNANIAFEGIELTTSGYKILGNDANELRPTGEAVLATTSAGVQSALISAPITGAGSLLRRGLGTISLGGLNTYTGGTTIESGTLDIRGVTRTPGISTQSFEMASLGAAPIRIQSGELSFTPNISDFKDLSNILTQFNKYHLRNTILVEGNFTLTAKDYVQSATANGQPYSTGNITSGTFNSKAFFNYFLDGPLDLSGGNRTISFGALRGGNLSPGVDVAEITNGTGLTLQLTSPDDATFGYQFIRFSGATSNTYTGATTVNAGIFLSLEKAANHDAIPGDLLINEGGVVFGGGTQIPDTARVTINSQGLADGIFQTTFSNETIGSLYGNGKLALYGGGVTFGAGDFAGLIKDDFDPDVADDEQNGVTKISNDTFTLTGTGAYNGPTLIREGTFLVNGTITAPKGGQSPVAVSSGARLGGSGTVSGVVTIENGGSVSPGNSPGTLTLGSLLLNPGSLLDFELAAPGTIGGGVNDLLSVTGNLRLDGFLNVSNLTGFDTGRYRLINYGGTLTDNDLQLGSVPGPFSYGIDVSTPNQVNLIVNAGIVQYWDGANATVNNLVDGGTAVWNTTSTNWTNASGTTNSLWDGNSAIFTGAAGTVTLGENISAKEIRFLTSPYEIYVGSGHSLTVGGVGIVNNSTNEQKFFVQGGEPSQLGSLRFVNTANITGNVTLNIEAASTGSNPGGSAVFADTSSLGNGKLIVGSAKVLGPLGSTVEFLNQSSAGDGKIEIQGSTVAGRALTGDGAVYFRDTATAGRAQIDVLSGRFVIVSPNVIDYLGGLLTFADASSAGAATIHIQYWAKAVFTDTATAGTASFTTDGITSREGAGLLQFEKNATAGQASILNLGNTTGNGGGGETIFTDTASAGSAKIRNQAKTPFDGFGVGAFTYFKLNSTAANAEIINEGSIGTGTFTGVAVTRFEDSASAGNSKITNLGGTGSFTGDGGITVFANQSTAANATLTANDGQATGNAGGTISFFDSSTAAQSTLIAQGGVGLGGEIIFRGTSQGGTAQATLNGGGTFDISQLTNAGLEIGSIDGAGFFRLGSKLLTVGSRNTDMIVSGSLTDGGLGRGIGGSLHKIGTGTLTLSGASTHTGSTTITAGKLLVNGSLGNTAVSASSGATLGGSGRIGGGVTIQNGGILSPGNSAGTLQMATLTLHPTSVLQYELNVANSVNNPANDLVNVDGNLTLDGLLNVTGSGSFSSGAYRLFNYGGSLVNNGLTILSLPPGFNAGDFRIQTDVSGQVNLTLVTGGSIGPIGPIGPIAPRGFQYWDGANNRANGTITGGSGEWRISETNWTNQPGNVNGPWAAETAIFSATPGVVALAEDIPFQQLIFAVDGYQITAGEGFTLQPTARAGIDVAAQASVAVAAPFFGRSSLTKTGEGTLLLAASQLSTLASLAVEKGAVYLNALLRAPSVVVSPDALLGGSGLAVGQVKNDGTLAPGNSVGTLSIDGDYTQGATGVFALEVGSLTAFDRLFVSGTARPAGNLRGIELGHRFTYGDQFPFLYAGQISGRFDTISLPDPTHLRGRFLVENEVGVLLVAPRSYTQVAATPNEENLARALDRWIGIETGDIGEVTLALDLLRERQYPAAFESFLPSFYEAALSTSVELSQNHLQLLHQQLSARRLGARLPRVQTQPVSDKDSKDSVPVEVESPDLWNSWVQGSGLYASDGLSQISDSDFQSGTVLLGADYAVNEHFAGGLFASYQNGWSDYANDAKLDLETTRFGLYGTADYGPLYVNAAVGVGTTDYEIRREIPFLNRRSSANPNGSEFFAELGTGYDFTCQNWTFGPQIALQYSRVELDDFTETGAGSLNLRLTDASTESLRSQLGGRVAYKWQVSPKLTIIPEVRLFWQHEYLQEGEDLAASLDGSNGSDFIYQTTAGDKNSVFLGAGVGFQIGSQIYANLYYNADFGRSDTTNHTLSISVNISF